MDPWGSSVGFRVSGHRSVGFKIGGFGFGGLFKISLRVVDGLDGPARLNVFFSWVVESKIAEGRLDHVGMLYIVLCCV